MFVVCVVGTLLGPVVWDDEGGTVPPGANPGSP